MSVIIKETVFNIKRSLFFNIILVFQFAFVFWQLTIISSYYLDIPSEQNFEFIHEGYAYYTLIRETRNDAEAEMAYQIPENPDYLENMKRAYRELETDPAYHYIVFRQADLKADYDFFSSKISEEQLLKFSPGFAEENGMGSISTYRIGNIRKAFEVKAYRMDFPAMRHFNLKISEGRSLKEQDFILQAGQIEIPVLLGNAFRPYINLGEELNGFLYSDTFKLKVTGFLEEKTKVAMDYSVMSADHVIDLDYAVIIPFFDMTEEVSSEEEKLFAQVNYEDALAGTIVVPEEWSHAEILNLQKNINNVYLENGLYPITLKGSPYGVSLFKKSTEEEMIVLFSLVILMWIFSIFSICIGMIIKIDKDLRRMAIQIMNGQSLGQLVVTYIMEILMINLSGFLLSLIFLKEPISGNIRFLIPVSVLTIVSVIFVSSVLCIKLASLDIERIMKRK